MCFFVLLWFVELAQTHTAGQSIASLRISEQTCCLL